MKSQILAVIVSGFVLISSAFAADAPAPKPQTQPQTQQQKVQRKARTPRTYHRAYIGGLLGVGIPASGYSSIGTHVAYGANANFRFSREFGIGAYYIHSSGSTTAGGVPSTFSLGFYGFEGNYFTSNGFNFGVRLGLASIAATATTPLGTLTANTSPFSFGPRFGYDYWIPHWPVTIGGELGFLFVEKSNSLALTTPVQVTYSTPFFAVVSILATVKYWF